MIDLKLIKILFVFYSLSSVLCYSYREKQEKGIYDNNGDDTIEFAPHHIRKQVPDNFIKHLNEYELDYFNEKLIEDIFKKHILNRNANKQKQKADLFFTENQQFDANKLNGLQYGDVSDQEVKSNAIENVPHSKQSAQFLINDHQSYEQHKKENLNDILYGPRIDKLRKYDLIFYVILAGCIIAGVVAIAATGFCLYTMHRSSRDAANVDYPAFNGTKSDPKISTTTIGDRRLAQSAQMYHYQHQKQQMIAMEKANSEMKNEETDSSDEETEEGDYTVYECPGLAPTGEIEVKNPLFKDEFQSPIVQTSTQVPVINGINVHEAPITPHVNTTSHDTVNITIVSPEAAVPQMK